MKMFKNKRKIIVLTSIFSALLIIITSCLIYLNTYYKAKESAIEAFAPMNTISYKIKGENIIFEPENSSKALIFYPGGKVEHSAYKPLMALCASNNVTCIIVKMPFNLAIFNVNAAKDIQKQYPHINEWYIAGHSLGGSMAALHVKENANKFKGLILLASYSTKDLSKTNLKTLSIYGSEDKVLNLKKYKKYKKNLTSNLNEFVIEGGCHAYFGMYGKQKGDGKPTISVETQLYQTSNIIINFINS